MTLTTLTARVSLLACTLLSVFKQFPDAEQPVRMYAPGRFASLRVVGQGGNSGFVSGGERDVTFFRDASWWGTTGLLAHDYLAGRKFSTLGVGDHVVLVYRHKRVAYLVTDVVRLYPDGAVGKAQAFNLMYRTPGRMVLQTCLPGNGFLFVIGHVDGLGDGVPRDKLGRRVKRSAGGLFAGVVQE